MPVRRRDVKWIRIAYLSHFSSPCIGVIREHNNGMSVATETVHLFSHSDVLSDSILYIQDDLEEASDDFEFVLYDIENELRQQIEIVVKPRLTKLETALQVTDQPVVIGLDLLDASQLKVSTK